MTRAQPKMLYTAQRARKARGELRVKDFSDILGLDTQSICRIERNGLRARTDTYTAYIDFENKQRKGEAIGPVARVERVCPVAPKTKFDSSHAIISLMESDMTKEHKQFFLRCAVNSRLLLSVDNGGLRE